MRICSYICHCRIWIIFILFIRANLFVFCLTGLCFWYRLSIVVLIWTAKVGTHSSETWNVAHHALMWIVRVVTLRIWNIGLQRYASLLILACLLLCMISWLIIHIIWILIFIDFNFSILCILIKSRIYILKCFTSKIAVCIIVTCWWSDITTCDLLAFCVVAGWLLMTLEVNYHWCTIFDCLLWFRTF